MGKGEGEGQPFSIESRDWLREQILGKTIYCQLLKREGQYGRMVGLLSVGCTSHLKLEENQIVLPFLPRRFLPWWFTGNRGTNLSEESIRRGWAFVYESDAGEFPHPNKREGYLTLMDEAQYVTTPVFFVLIAHGILPTWGKESKSWNVEERDFIGDAGTVQEASQAGHHSREYRRHRGDE